MKKEKSSKKILLKKKSKKKNKLNPSKYLSFKNTENLFSTETKKLSDKKKTSKKKVAKKNFKRTTVLNSQNNNFLKKEIANKNKKIFSGLDLVYIIKNDKNLKNLLKKEIYNKEIKNLDNEIQLIKNNTKINFEIFIKENEILKLENLENKKHNDELRLKNLEFKKECESFLLENNRLKLENKDLKNENNFVIFKNEKFKTENLKLNEDLKKESNNFLEHKFIIEKLLELINEKIFLKNKQLNIKQNFQNEIQNIMEKLKNLEINNIKSNDKLEEKENIWNSKEIKELSLSQISKVSKNEDSSLYQEKSKKEKLKKNKENLYSSETLRKVKIPQFEKNQIKKKIQISDLNNYKNSNIKFFKNSDIKNLSKNINNSSVTKNEKQIFESEISNLKYQNESKSPFDNLKYSDITHINSKVETNQKKNNEKKTENLKITKSQNFPSLKSSDEKSKIEIIIKNENSNISDNSKNSFNLKSEEIMAKIQKLTNCLNCSDESSHNYSNTFSKYKSNFSNDEISTIEKKNQKTKLDIMCSKELKNIFANLDQSDLKRSKLLLNDLKSKVFSENNESFGNNFEFYESQLGNIEEKLRSSLLQHFDQFYASKVELPNFYKND